MTWRDSFERVSVRRSRCKVCGEEMDHAGGRPQRHMAAKHGGVVGTAPTLTVNQVPNGQGGSTPPTPTMPNDEEALDAPDPRDVRARVLETMHLIAGTEEMPANARVAAGRLISDIERLQEMDVEEDEDEAEGRVVERYRNALRKKGDLEEEFRASLRDPAVLERVERLCAEVRATL